MICEESLGKLDSRSAQPILAKFYFYKALCEEKEGVWDERPYIICYRGVCLNHDIFSQSSLINIIVRTLLAKNMAEQANQFVTKTEFP